ncbi:MAG: ribosome-associated protein [Solirubrobacteraceae bacterium]|nr:ribosome-associated protein [Solirubrobacteraceae bacterium]
MWLGWRVHPDAADRDVPIREDSIRLGQLLKLAGLADSGGDARELVRDGGVRVNGEVERRRGRQLRRGDVVTAGDATLRVV